MQLYCSDVFISEVQTEVGNLTADIEIFVLQVHNVSNPSVSTFAIEKLFLLPSKKLFPQELTTACLCSPPPQNQHHMVKLQIYCMWRWRLQLLRSVVRKHDFAWGQIMAAFKANLNG